MSFSIKKTISAETIPCKGKAVVTLQLTASPDISTVCRDILIIPEPNILKLDAADSHKRVGDGINHMINLLTTSTKGEYHKTLGGTCRMGFIRYGNKTSDLKEISLSSDVCQVKKAVLDETSTFNLEYSLVKAKEMLTNSWPTAKTLFLYLDTDLPADSKVFSQVAEMKQSGVEVFVATFAEAEESGKRLASEPLSHHLVTGKVSAAGYPIMDTFAAMAALLSGGGNLSASLTETVGAGFKLTQVSTPSVGTVTYPEPVGSSLVWNVGSFALEKTETATLTYEVENIGQSAGVKTVSTTTDSSSPIVNPIPVPSVTALTEACDSGGGEPGGSGGGEPGGGDSGGGEPGGGDSGGGEPGGGDSGGGEPGGGDSGGGEPGGGSEVVDPTCPSSVSFVMEGCQDAVQVEMPDVALSDLGRIIQVNVTLKNICPNKRVAVGILLSETDADGKSHNRGMKTALIPAHNGTGCADVTINCIEFCVPEALDVSGSTESLCNPRSFKVRAVANYVDSDYVCCGEIQQN